MGSEDKALDDVVMPADLPLEAIAEEVQNSWHLKVCFACLTTMFRGTLCSQIVYGPCLSLLHMLLPPPVDTHVMLVFKA